jgi:hypothetical protein
MPPAPLSLPSGCHSSLRFLLFFSSKVICLGRLRLLYPRSFLRQRMVLSLNNSPSIFKINVFRPMAQFFCTIYTEFWIPSSESDIGAGQVLMGNKICLCFCQRINTRVF